MTDTDTSGANTAPVAPQAASAASAETSAQPETQSVGAFGATRGSGLARGKRTGANTKAASAAPAPSGAYQPTALEVIMPQREYKNPFGDDTPAPAASVEAAAPASETPFVPKAAPAAAVAPASPATPEPSPVEEKAEIRILPPTETKRVALSWESTPPAPPASATPETGERDFRRNDRRGERRDDRREDRRDERPYFVRPERRDASRPADPARPSDPVRSDDSARPSEPARSGSSFRPRESTSSDRRSHRPVETPKPRGFIAWLKGLFGATPKVEAGRPEERSESRPGGHSDDSHHRRRRHRGGRGRHGEFRGDENRQNRPNFNSERSGSPEGEPRGEAGGENRGHSSDSRGGRRRHRGGRGRGRDDRGPRPEGQQGGGAI